MPRDPADDPPAPRSRADDLVLRSMVPARARAVQGRRAGVVSRAVADVVDVAVVVAILLSGYVAVVVVRFAWHSRGFTLPAPSFLLVLACAAAVAVAYLTAAWSTTGRSYGKHLMGLRVVGPFGRLRLVGAFARAVLCVVAPIGFAWVAVSRHHRSLQDVVLRTSVVYDWSGPTGSSPGKDDESRPAGQPGRMETTATSSARRAHRAPRVATVVVAAALATVSLTACSQSGQNRTCDRLDGVRSSIEALRDVNVSENGLAALESGVANVRSQLALARSELDQAVQPQADAVQASLGQLQTAVEAARANPTTQSLGAARNALQATRTAVGQFRSAVAATC